jgi:outer membrane protein TolC
MRNNFTASTVRLSTYCLISLVIVLFGGCRSAEKYFYNADKYTYKNTRQTYAHLACNYKEESEISAASTSAPCSTDQPLNLKKAVEIAQANNPDINMATARIHQARALMQLARAPFYPFVKFYTEYLQGDAPSAFLFKTIDQGKLPPDTDFNEPGWFQNYETGVKVDINLYNGGKDILSYKMAENKTAISESERQSIDNRLVTTVIGIYYSAQAARDFIRIAKESVAAVEAQLRIMRVRFKAGGVLKSDILSLEVRLANAREDLVRSQSNLKATLAGLAQVMGLDPDTSLKLTSVAVQPVELPQNYSDGIIHALEHRPELKKIRDQLVQSRMAMDLARAGYWPRIDLAAHYYLDDPNFFFSADRDNWTAALMLNWDIFTGFSTRNAEAKALAMLEEMMSADRKNVLAIKADVKNAYLKMDEVLARMQVTEKSVVMAEESLQLVKQQYEGGSVGITRYLETELALSRARTRKTAAFYDHEKALAEIQRAIGFWLVVQ